MGDLIRKLDREFIIQSVLGQMDRGLDWEGHYAMAMREAGISRAEILQRVEERSIGLLALPLFLYLMGCIVTRFNVYFCIGMMITAVMYYAVLALMRQLKMPLVTGAIVVFSFPFLVVSLFALGYSLSILMPAPQFLWLIGMGVYVPLLVTGGTVAATYLMLKRPRRPLSVSTIHPRISKEET